LATNAFVNDIDGTVRVVAVDEKIWPLGGTAGYAKTMLGCVNYRDDFETC
jgi:hypothetical protein